MLIHVGIPILNDEDVKDFYKDVLMFDEMERFTLNNETSKNIFGVDEHVEVVKIFRNGLYLELFITNQKKDCTFNHVFIEYADSSSVSKQAEEKGYEVIKRQGKYRTTFFIKDKSGNIFEI